MDVKTVRRALASEEPPKRAAVVRPRLLDPFRDRIQALLRADPKITAKRVGRVLEPDAGRIKPRTLRKYVADLRGALLAKEAFVHRTHRSGHTLEGDFGESWAVVADQLRKVKFFVTSLPCTHGATLEVPRRSVTHTKERSVELQGLPAQPLGIELEGAGEGELHVFAGRKQVQGICARLVVPSSRHRRLSSEVEAAHARGIRPELKDDSLEVLAAHGAIKWLELLKSTLTEEHRTHHRDVLSSNQSEHKLVAYTLP